MGFCSADWPRLTTCLLFVVQQVTIQRGIFEEYAGYSFAFNKINGTYKLLNDKNTIKTIKMVIKFVHNIPCLIWRTKWMKISLTQRVCPVSKLKLLLNMYLSVSEHSLTVCLFVFSFLWKSAVQNTHTKISTEHNKECLINISRYKFSLVISGLTNILKNVNNMVSVYSRVGAQAQETFTNGVMLYFLYHIYTSFQKCSKSGRFHVFEKRSLMLKKTAFIWLKIQ